MKIPALLLVLVVTSACDLMHADQKLYCARATGDPEKCRARPDWCISEGGPECVGASCPGRYCGLDAEQKRCVRTHRDDQSCLRDARLLDGNRVPDLQRYGWVWDKLGPAGRSLSGQVLSEKALADLPQEDRRQLCGAYPGEPCELHWDEARGFARCMLVGDVCGGCTYRIKPYKCWAKNLCSGVICP
jgi:hypothetical protein